MCGIVGFVFCVLLPADWRPDYIQCVLLVCTKIELFTKERDGLEESRSFRSFLLLLASFFFWDSVTLGLYE